jgi:DNA-directed RNA polymerase III subunit RPC4
LEKEEQRRKEDEVKAAEDAVRAKNEADASTRGRGRGRGKGRGRGRYEDEGRRSPVASGPFSAGQVSKETQQLNRRWSSRGSGWKGLRVSGNKEGARGGRGKGKAAQNEDVETKPKLDANGDISMEDSGDDNDYVSSDADEFNGQRRMNVEKLGVIDLTQDESDLNQFAPIRVARVPHKERGFGVRHDHAVKQEDDAAVKVDTIEGDEVVSISKSKEVQQVTGFQAVYSDSESDSKPHIKLEADLDDAQSKENGALVSPQTITKGKEKVRARTLSTASVEEYDEEIEIDREEEQRQRKDLELLRAELGKVEKDGDALMSDLDAVERRAEKVYLFQFPPILPHLEPIFVKPDPDALDGNDVMQVDAPSSSNKPIMINDDGKGEQPRLPSGAVGKMKVHASGKVTLDWGRMTLTLGVGGKANFLQTVVAATLPDMKKDDGSPSRSEEAGQAINLGHVKEKFVVTPDWEELLG